MARYLGAFLSGLSTGLAPDVIVIIGDITQAWSRVGPIVSDIVRTRALPGSTTKVVPSDSAMQPRLRGAVTLVVQQHFGAPHVA
jgi:predicted NBD/HSP70 family sugar kinase